MAKDKAKRAMPKWTAPEYEPPYKQGSGLQPNEAPKKKASIKSGATRPYYDVKKIFKTN